jgi:hypothetical protein
MHQDLARSSPDLSLPSHPLTMWVHAPSRLPYPTCQPQGLTLTPSVDHALDRGPGRAPRNPPLLSIPSTKPARAPAPLDLAESPGELPNPLVHHRHQSTPNQRRPRRPRHVSALNSTLSPRRSGSRAWGEEVSRSLMAHAHPLSPPLTSTPHRPEPPLNGRAPAGCRSGQKRARANRHWQTSKTTAHAVGRVHTAAPANADAGHPLPSLSLTLAHRAPPREYLASAPLLRPLPFVQTTPPPPHSLTRRTPGLACSSPVRRGSSSSSQHPRRRSQRRPFSTKLRRHSLSAFPLFPIPHSHDIFPVPRSSSSS